MVELFVCQLVEAWAEFSWTCVPRFEQVTYIFHIQAFYPNKRSVTKEKLIVWLIVVYYILNSFSLALLEYNAVPIVDGIDFVDI